MTFAYTPGLYCPCVSVSLFGSTVAHSRVYACTHPKLSKLCKNGPSTANLSSCTKGTGEREKREKREKKLQTRMRMFNCRGEKWHVLPNH
ncbi:hypothetical protein POVWA2_040130 [Plasmodium ovale wallikeri]|uniref:Uncharacterized protein n=1 Tax=Plasmodium ovale wallikeri TaxID=864142 RepID=A0A1A8Z9J8_PLAOA|nr:hypothetical protein POVWA2_040130 [Plasmodium ovale wallikeri]